FGGRGGGGGWLRGAQPGRDNDPSSGTRPATTVSSPDLVYFNAASDAYKEITGIEYVPVHRTPEGAFFQFGYFQFGVPSFSTPGWGLAGAGPSVSGQGGPQADSPEEVGGRVRTPPGGNAGGGQRPGGRGGMVQQVAGGRGGSMPAGGSGTDAQLLARLEAAGVEAFADWATFQHPDLGEVEIGGFLPYVTHNPPPDRLPELGAQHGEFLVKLAGMLPRVRIAETEVTAHGGGLFTVTVHVENAGFFPTSIQHGVRSRAVGPTLVQLQVDADQIMTGADKTTSVGVLAGSGARDSVTWVIRGREGGRVEVRLLSAKAGHDTTTITLR
ncbi:MAG: hypothetical protein HKO65_18185, partial [Gemmatimonadetes bacterium]|nr:hypothetical protein [Gemmatimonadota bacterium]